MKSNKFVKLKSKKSVAQTLICLSLLVGFLLLSCLSAYAYFSAKASESGDTSFGSLSLLLTDSSGGRVTASELASQYFSHITPGDKIQIKDIRVNNNGSHSLYALINLDIVIGEETGNPLKYNIWTNIYGEEVNVNNFAINNAEATLIKNSSSVTTNISWDVPGEALTKEYVGAGLTATFAAYGVQSLLPDAENYKNEALYASYFICNNVEEIKSDNQVTDTHNLNITTEPLKAFSYKNIFNTAAANAVIVDGQGTTKYGFEFENLEGQYTFSFSGSTTSSFYYTTEINGAYGSGIALTNGATINILEGRTLIIYASSADDWSTISNIQLEKGSVATSYEAYKGYSDEVNYTTFETTKNIGMLVLDGTENWVDYTYSNLGKSFKLALNEKQVGAKTSKCSHFENVDSSWSEANKNEKGIYSDHGTETNLYFRCPNEDVTNLDLFKEYLANEYANGTPVTVWYKLTSPIVSKFYTSKNLYAGAQKLVFDTDGGVEDSTDEDAIITLTDANLVKYLSDKNFVVSANIKLGETDKAKISSGKFGFNMQITYINATNGNRSAIKEYLLGKFDYNKNLFIWLNNSEAKAVYTQEQLANVTSIEIQLRSVETSEYSSFEIKNIQLELGTSPTDFEMYDATVYARVNGVALRTVQGVADTYDAINGTIVRKTAMAVLKSSNTWGRYYIENEGYSFTLQINNKKMGYQISTCSHFTNLNSAWVTSYKDRKGVYSDHGTLDYTYFRTPIDTSFTETEDFTAWIDEQNENGTPVILWYQLATPTTEQI